MNEISIKEFDRQEVGRTIADFSYAVLATVGIPTDKYPEIAAETEPDYIVEHYQGRSRFWVARENGTLVGTIALLERNADVAELKRMFVAPELHGSGLGKRLLDQAIDFARVQGYTRVVLDTDLAMARAHRFYEKNGFVVTAHYSDYRVYSLSL